MRISYNWLKDFVDIKINPQRLAELLTIAGLEVVSTEKYKDDFILETEVTTNRPDWLSIIGTAREVAAITGKKLKLPKISGQWIVNSEQLKDFSVKVEDKNGCPRYTARLIKDVKVAQSPDLLIKRLDSIGVRPVNNIVDITNYCLFELGQPLHAFDYDKLKGQCIIVRQARDGEKITTIDGTERVLDKDILVIADKVKPVAIAGIMGGVDTEVGLDTKNVLLESAYFDPIVTRRAARKLGISTESSYRFERNVDITAVSFASQRATDLIYKIANAKEVSRLKDIYPAPARRSGVNHKKSLKTKDITLRISRIEKILGSKIKKQKAKDVLSALGFLVKDKSKDSLSVCVPAFRSQDITREIDLIEELARITGYDKLPLTMPVWVSKAEKWPIPDSFYFVKITEDILISQGLNEVITYSLINPDTLKKFNAHFDPIGIKNPLSAEQQIMRPGLLYGILDTINWNLNRKQQDIKIFELSKVYLKESSKFIEKTNLCFALCGNKFDNWQEKTARFSIFDLKGIIETIFNRLGVGNYKFVKKDLSSIYTECIDIYVTDKCLGSFGRISKEILSGFDIEPDVFACEIDFDMLSGYIKLDKIYKPIPRYPSVVRDISLSIDESVKNLDIVAVIKETGKDVVSNIKLQDLYSGPQIPSGEKGLLYRIEFQSPDRTLTEEQVNKIIKDIRENLVQRLGAHIR